jgi:hypothetical protein
MLNLSNSEPNPSFDPKGVLFTEVLLDTEHEVHGDHTKAAHQISRKYEI